MTKFGKELTLAIAPYKVIRIAVTDASSFKECDDELNAELNKMPQIRLLNKAEIKKVLG